MFQKQKEVILDFLKTDMSNKCFKNQYWFPYKDFFDPTDNFTEFSCERLDGKQEYITLIESLFSVDESAKAFVKVYGFEEDNEDLWIYADDLIVFSRLSLFEIEHIFNNVDNIFPSEIGEFDFNNEKDFIIDKNGHLISAINLSNSGHFVYYCWWD